MLPEISSLDLEDRDDYARRSPPVSLSSSLHEHIFTQTDCRPTMKPVTIFKSLNQEEAMLRGTFGASPVAADIKGKVDVVFSWGGKDGPSISASASASAKDDSGNTVELKVKVDDDYSGQVAISGSHDNHASYETPKPKPQNE